MGRPFVRTGSAVVKLNAWLGLLRWGGQTTRRVVCQESWKRRGLTEYIGGSWETPGPERGEGVSK